MTHSRHPHPPSSRAQIGDSRGPRRQPRGCHGAQSSSAGRRGALASLDSARDPSADPEAFRHPHLEGS